MYAWHTYIFHVFSLFNWFSWFFYLHLWILIKQLVFCGNNYQDMESYTHKLQNVFITTEMHVWQCCLILLFDWNIWHCYSFFSFQIFHGWHWPIRTPGGCSTQEIPVLLQDAGMLTWNFIFLLNIFLDVKEYLWIIC